jgi:hypothetical protein
MIGVLPILGIVAGGAALYVASYLFAPASTSRQIPGPTVDDDILDIDALLAAAPLGNNPAGRLASVAERLSSAKVIVREFQRAGLPLSLALAAVANADVESGLNPRATGDGGKSVGLFQLHESGGGRGLSVAQRQDPTQNVRRIISEFQAARARTTGKNLAEGGATVGAESLNAALARGATVAELAGLFGFHVERPYDLKAALRERPERARKLFPGVAALPGRVVDAGRMASGGGLLLAGLLAVTGIGVGVWAYRRRLLRR